MPVQNQASRLQRRQMREQLRAHACSLLAVRSFLDTGTFISLFYFSLQRRAQAVHVRRDGRRRQEASQSKLLC
jgi:hypothetical protein